MGEKFYRGYFFTAQVTGVADGQVTVAIDGTFLEAPIADVNADRNEPLKGSEVTVRGTVTLPVRRDESK